MATPSTIDIKVISAPLPEGWEGTPDEFRQQVFSTLTFTGTGSFLTGQVGGATPTTNVGIYIDGQDVYTWDEESNGYLPLNTHPIGSILPFLGSVVPKHYLMCDGGTHLRKDYVDLYALIGDSYKLQGAEAPDDDHFCVPNLKGRTLFGAGQGDYNPLGVVGAPSPSKMREMTLHAYDGLEWPRRLVSKHVDQPAAMKNPGDVLVYTGDVGNNYTRSMPPHLVINWIVRSK